VIVKTDPITDEDNSMASISSTFRDDNLRVTWACSGRALWTFVNPGILALRSDPPPPWIIYRFDQDAPDTALLLREPNETSTAFLVPAAQQARIARRIRTASRLVVRVFGTYAGQLDFTFDLTGAAVALDGLSCSRWVPPVTDAGLTTAERNRVEIDVSLMQLLRPDPQSPRVRPLTPVADIVVYQPSETVPFSFVMLGRMPIPGNPARLPAERLQELRTWSRGLGGAAVLLRPSGDAFEAVAIAPRSDGASRP
jgi:hypothetical protein